MPRAQLDHEGAGLGQGQRERPDGALVTGAEGNSALPGRDVVDSGLRGGDGAGAGFVAGPQPVALARLAAQVLERALVGEPARAHDRDPVAELFDLGQQVAGKQHGHPPGRELPDQVAHVAHPARVQTGRRLVEQQQLRLPQQRGGKPEPLPHPVRVAADLVLGALAQADDLQHLVDPRRRPTAVERREQLEVAATIHVGVEGGRFDEAGDALESRDALLRVAPEEPDGPGRRPDQSEHHSQRGGLAGAVGAEVAEDVADLDRQVDLVDRDDLAVALDQAADLDRSRLRHRPRNRSSERPGRGLHRGGGH